MCVRICDGSSETGQGRGKIPEQEGQMFLPFTLAVH
jgi:hypothetical protein